MIEEKRCLRREMRGKRREYPDREILDKEITQHFLSSVLYLEADALLAYASFDTETDTGGVIQQALHDGKKVFLPRCTAGTNQMRFCRVVSLDELHADAYGIPAPPENSDRLFRNESRAVCIVPGLAFTKSGERLGYGKGYYDTFLEKIDVCTVGFCYGFQMLDFIPTEPHDKRMQYLCTEQGLLKTSFQMLRKDL